MIKEIKKDVLNKFKDNSKRLEHILGVTQMSLSLARKHGVDLEKMEIAALFHDYMKDEKNDVLKKCVSPYIKTRYKNVPECFHAFAAANILEQSFNYHDKDVLNAIKYHVTAKKNMNKLAKILFVADFCEPSRTHAFADQVREKAHENLDRAFALAVSKKVEHILSEGKEVDKNQLDVLKTLKKINFSILEVITDELEGLKVKDLRVFDFESTSPFYDYFVIATVNDRQGQAAVTHIKKAIKNELRHVEKSTGWILIDAFSVIIHLFNEENREYYGLDKRLLGVKRIK